MSKPGLKTLEACARATGSAFGCEEAERVAARPAPVLRVLVLSMLVLAGGAVLFAHRVGWPGG